MNPLEGNRAFLCSTCCIKMTIMSFSIRQIRLRVTHRSGSYHSGQELPAGIWQAARGVNPSVDQSININIYFLFFWWRRIAKRQDKSSLWLTFDCTLGLVSRLPCVRKWRNKIPLEMEIRLCQHPWISHPASWLSCFRKWDQSEKDVDVLQITKFPASL